METLLSFAGFKSFILEQDQQQSQDQEKQAQIVKGILQKVSNPENIKRVMAQIARELGYGNVDELKQVQPADFNKQLAHSRTIQNLEIQAKQLKNQQQESFIGSVGSFLGSLISGIWNTVWSVLKHVLSPIKYVLSAYFEHEDKITNTALLVLIYAVATSVGGSLPGVLGIYGFLWFHQYVMTPPLQSLSNAGMA
jgi:hypothetical protein